MLLVTQFLFVLVLGFRSSTGGAPFAKVEESTAATPAPSPTNPLGMFVPVDF